MYKQASTGIYKDLETVLNVGLIKFVAKYWTYYVQLLKMEWKKGTCQTIVNWNNLVNR